MTLYIPLYHLYHYICIIMNREKVYIKQIIGSAHVEVYGNVKLLIKGTGAIYGTVLKNLRANGTYCSNGYVFNVKQINKK